MLLLALPGTATDPGPDLTAPKRENHRTTSAVENGHGQQDLPGHSPRDRHTSTAQWLSALAEIESRTRESPDYGANGTDVKIFCCGIAVVPDRSTSTPFESTVITLPDD